MATPGEIKISLGKSITLEQAKHSGLQVSCACDQVFLGQGL